MHRVSSGFRRIAASSALLMFMNLSGVEAGAVEPKCLKVWETKEASTMGTFQDETLGEVTWAKHFDVVARPIEKVLDLLRDHETTKSPRIDEYTVKKTNPPGLLEQHEVSYLIKPFLFVRVEWKELWTYFFAPDKKRAEIFYKKTEGTHYIPHLCSEIELVRVSDKETKVYLYEEAKASGRTKEETLKGLRGTIQALRTK